MGLTVLAAGRGDEDGMARVSTLLAKTEEGVRNGIREERANQRGRMETCMREDRRFDERGGVRVCMNVRGPV